MPQSGHGFREGQTLHALTERKGFEAGVNDEFLLRLEVFTAFVKPSRGSGSEASFALDGPKVARAELEHEVDLGSGGSEGGRR